MLLEKHIFSIVSRLRFAELQLEVQTALAWLRTGKRW
jgi:hypothetical protein